MFRARWVTALIGLIIGIGIGTGYSFFSSLYKDFFFEQREFTAKYHFINPLLACGDDNFSRLSNRAVRSLEGKTQTLLNEQKSKGLLSEGSVYFRELNGGSWFGINEEVLFTPRKFTQSSAHNEPLS